MVRHMAAAWAALQHACRGRGSWDRFGALPWQWTLAWDRGWGTQENQAPASLKQQLWRDKQPHVVSPACLSSLCVFSINMAALAGMAAGMGKRRRDLDDECLPPPTSSGELSLSLYMKNGVGESVSLLWHDSKHFCGQWQL